MKKNSKETCKKGGRGKGWGKYLHNHIIIGQTANKVTITIRLHDLSNILLFAIMIGPKDNF
jgi:hypothetical protein